MCIVNDYSGYNTGNTGTKKPISGMELFRYNKTGTLIQMRWVEHFNYLSANNHSNSKPLT